MTIQSTNEWHVAVADPSVSHLAALGSVVRADHVPELVAMVGTAGGTTWRIAHRILLHEGARLQLAREDMNTWTAAVLVQHEPVLEKWRRGRTDETLRDVYDNIVSVLPEGATYSLLVDGLGTPVSTQRAWPERCRGASCHYSTAHLDLYLGADADGGLISWKLSEDFAG